MEFELGRTYSGYKFLDVVVRSRNVVAYRVQNTLAQRLEILTALPAAARDDQEAAERLLREMRIRARLAHPNIVTFYTALPIEGQLVMTTELFEGLPLAERLQLGPLPWQEALEASCQLLAAAGAGHDQHVVHRDITPTNILCGPDGVWKLTNYGLACHLSNGQPGDCGSMVGNPRYISPEQVKGNQELDHRSDLYSLGAVMYEMFCGRPPFDSKSQFELMLAHVNQTPEPPSQVHSSVPDFLDAILLKSLAKEPADRYQSAAEFSDAMVNGRASFLPAAVEPEPVAAAEPTPVAEPEPVVAAVAVEPAPVVEPEPSVAAVAVEPTPVAQPEPVVAAVAAVAVETAPVAQPDVAAVAVEPAPVAESEPVVAAVAVEAAPVAQPEPVAAVAVEPAPVAESEPVVAAAAVETAPVAQPEPVAAVAVEPAPVAESEPVVAAVAVETAPGAQPEPVVP